MSTTTSTKKLSFTQKVAIVWLKNIDRSLLIFKFLKNLSLPFRYAFYTGFFLFTLFMMKLTGTLLMAFIGEGATGIELLKFTGDILFYGVSIGAALVTTQESIYKLDVPHILQEQKELKAKIKDNKLEVWRLRNMPILIRIFIYILVFFFLYFIMNTQAQAAYLHLFATANLADPNVQKQIQIFINEFDRIQQWFVLLYVIFTITLDYFVSKKRAQRKLEVYHEAL